MQLVNDYIANIYALFYTSALFAVVSLTVNSNFLSGNWSRSSGNTDVLVSLKLLYEYDQLNV